MRPDSTGAEKLNVAERKRYSRLIQPTLVLASILFASACCSEVEAGERASSTGPLRPSVSNSRYFSDASQKAIYLTGSHTWANLSDGLFYSPNQDPPAPFDYAGYLNLIQGQNHNFIRLWAGILLPKAVYNAELPFTGTFFPTPLPYARTGPGTAQDGKLKFNLTQFNQPFFDRLRSRVIDAGNRGIYVSIMLFEGWNGYGLPEASGWNYHPFNISNNVNAINGDLNGDGFGKEVSTLEVPSIADIQRAFVRKVIDTVNDLDNVLFEIANEAGSVSINWQYEMMNYVRVYESTKPKQHPVGMTAPAWDGASAGLFESSADWISPSAAAFDNASDPYFANPPVANGGKVSILDTDHIGWNIFSNDTAGARAWVWKSFMRGHNPILMEDLSGSAGWIAARSAMGDTLRYARTIELAAMEPLGNLASTGYCLANPGREYLVYVPSNGDREWTETVSVDFSESSKAFHVEWFNPRSRETIPGGVAIGGGRQTFTAPFIGDAVLYLAAQ